MKPLRLMFSVSLLLASLFPYAPPAFAHCPQAPFDNLVLDVAPITPLSGLELSLESVASGLTSPLWGMVAPGHPSRLFVVDQAGKLWAIDLNTGAKSVFLDVSGRLISLGVAGPNTFDERGFLGTAFHPRYRTNGLLYTYTSEPVDGRPDFTTIPVGSTPNHQNVIAEWRVPNPRNPDSVVDPTSRRELLRVDWPQFNHNGGDLVFGPDGLLYFSMGDGGGADDTDGKLIRGALTVGHQGDGNAQKLNTPLGKFNRIDVDGRNSANGQYGIPSDNPFVDRPGAVREIYAFGFRNPWRFSFDAAAFDDDENGQRDRSSDDGDRSDLFVGDVGQNHVEEVDRVVKGGNFGWNHKEGTMFFHIVLGAAPGFASPVPQRPAPPNLIDPIAQYRTHHEGHAIIGGFVYRGERFEELRGQYVFGDHTRVFQAPPDQNNYGRLFHFKPERDRRGLHTIQEFRGFAESIAELGLRRGRAACGGLFPPTLSVLGMGQDARGELYVMGNFSGFPFGNDGVVLRIAPPPQR